MSSFLTLLVTLGTRRLRKFGGSPFCLAFGFVAFISPATLHA
jgi:hypothetical protein